MNVSRTILDNRKATTTAMLWVVIGLVLLAFIILVTAKGMGLSWDIIGGLIKQTTVGKVQNAIDSPSLYTRASGASFERLNYEIELLLKDKDEEASRILPYTLGQYRLVGFNKDKVINSLCIDEAMNNIEPQDCNGRSCLCLCTGEESCECTEYLGVDYFITSADQVGNKAEKLEDLQEEITGGDAYCLLIRGAINEDHIKLIEPYDNWWHSQNAYIQKMEINGKTAIFFGRADDLEFDTEQECDESKIDTTGCSTVSGCLDYMDAQLGCGWRYSCENNVCAAATGLSCGVLEVPQINMQAKQYLCVDSEKSLSEICVADSSRGYVNAYAGELLPIDSTNSCYECVGIGGEGADEFGWKLLENKGSEQCIA